jgi:hypothetical protein
MVASKGNDGATPFKILGQGLPHADNINTQTAKFIGDAIPVCAGLERLKFDTGLF